MDEETKPEEETKEEEQLETLEEAPAEEPVEAPEPECDPLTMSCDEMRDQIIDLSLERAKYDNSIKKIDEIKTVIPSEELEKIQLEAVNKKKDIDDKIYNIFEKFTVCSRPVPPEEQAKEE
ncbi:MAG: hypothetical protein NT129_06700 [Candidatus Aenigmarchaeota archaeon]|nr:hypothetical protein [Candidatus Aenigmarchaeota archaeon]